MPDTPYLLSKQAQNDIAAIRRYTCKEWGNEQWLKYKHILFSRMQILAHTSEIGIKINEISSEAYRYPHNQYIFYYLKREKNTVFVGILSCKIAPEQHLVRKKEIGHELGL